VVVFLVVVAAGVLVLVEVVVLCANTDEPTLKTPNAKASEMIFFICVKLQNEPMLSHYSNNLTVRRLCVKDCHPTKTLNLCGFYNMCALF
jgi:hypothetical protein